MSSHRLDGSHAALRWGWEHTGGVMTCVGGEGRGSYVNMTQLSSDLHHMTDVTGGGPIQKA